MKKYSFVLILLLMIPLIASITWNEIGVILTSFTSGEDGTATNAGASETTSQRFQVSSTATMQNVSMMILRAGTVSTVQIAVFGADADGSPNLADPKSVLVTDLNYITTSAGGAWYNLTLPQFTLTANTNYSLRINSSSFDGSNFVSWRRNSGGGYANGEQWDDDSVKVASADMMFVIYKAGQENVVLNTPQDGNISSVVLVPFNATANITDSGTTLTNQTIILWNPDGTINQTNTTTGLGGVYDNTFSTLTLVDNVTFNWSAEYCAVDGTCGTAIENRTIAVDIREPIVDITAPTGDQGSFASGRNLTLDWTITETNLGTCWYEYNGVNTTTSCTVSATNENLTVTDRNNKSVVFWANDSVGLLGNDTITWTYALIENSIIFNAITSEGQAETFELNITMDSGTSLDSATFDYNGTSYGVSIVQQSTNNFSLRTSLTAPTVTANTNYTFLWNMVVDGTQVNSTANQQQVNNLGIDDCSAFTILLANYTIYDEELLNRLSNVTDEPFIELDVDIFTVGGSTPIIEYSNNFTNVTEAVVCLESALGSSTYQLDMLARYGATDYVTEFHNIQNFSLTSSTVGINTSLYPLKTVDSQEFLVTVKDAGLAPIPGAVIILSRKYVGEGVFRTVEAPKTNADGQTLLHIVLSNVIYTIQIVKDGVVLGTFDDIVGFCDDLASGDCTFILNTDQATITGQDYTNLNDLSYIITFDDTTRTATLSFVIPSVTSATIRLDGLTFDSYVNNTVCTDSLTASSGSVSCTVPASAGNATFLFKIFKDGQQVGTNIFSLEEKLFDLDKGTSVILLFFLVVTLPLIFISSGIAMMVAVVFGLIIASILTFSGSGGFIGFGATFLWLIVAVVIIIIKIGGRE